MDTSETFNCVCHHDEHLLRLAKWDDRIYLSILLSQPNSFFERLTKGIRYLFGKRNEKDGHFDVFLFDPDDKNRFLKALDCKEDYHIQGTLQKQLLTNLASEENILEIGREEDYLYFQIALFPHKNLLKRSWVALKYLFGYRSKYGLFDEFIFQPDKIKELSQIITINV